MTDTAIPSAAIAAVELPVVRASWPVSWHAAVPAQTTHPDDPSFVRAAGHAGRLLPASTFDALVDLTDEPGPTGALLLRGVPVGDLPATPAHPTDPTSKDHVSEFALLSVARRLGQPVGYLPEHGGSLVQNLVPTRSDRSRQTSTSSAVTLAFHTETAFHPHRPRYLVLLCLRGDPTAATTLCSVAELLPALSPATRNSLRKPWYRTGVDASFGGHGRDALDSLGAPRPILTGTDERPAVLYDADLMVATTRRGRAALADLDELVATTHRSLVLDAGDLLIVDNTRCVHGRSPFTPRFDGTDRWLQRTFVVADLVPSDGERAGRVITTTFSG